MIMPDEVILTLKLRVKKDSVEEVREQIEDFINDFLDETVAKKEGEVEESNV